MYRRLAGRVSIGYSEEPSPKIYWQWPGEVGTMQTVAMMVQMVNESWKHPWIIDRAVQQVSGCINDLSCERQRLLSWVKASMYFVRDPIDLETLKHPVTWVERRIREGKDIYGDCASMSVYLATLLKAIHHLPYFKVVGRGDFLHHVYVLDGNEELDATMEYSPIEAPKNPKREVLVAI